MRQPFTRSRVVVLAAGLAAMPLVAVSCGGDDSNIATGEDAGQDGGGEATPPPDGQTKDTGQDAGRDVGSVDSAMDTGADSGSDTGGDVGVDTGLDTGVDTGADTGVDAAIDTGTDSGGLLVCGDGVRQPPEQCDDGNVINLDGCDSACRFEQETRATKIQMMFAADAFCTKNALGGAFASAAQPNVQSTIDTSVTDGSISFLLKYLAITDLSGMSGSTKVGSISGTPVAYVAPVNGNNDLDWWYNVDATTIDGQRNPNDVFAGTFSSTGLDASGGHVLLAILAQVNLDVSAARIHLPIGASSVPTQSATGLPPGHRASEHLDPALTSFAAAGGTVAAPTGQLCGNTTAASLAAAPVPTQLQQGGSFACVENYTASNAMLDVLVTGCKALGGFVTVISQTQPDTSNPDAPPAGSGAPYHLTANASHHVTTCTDSNNTAVPLASCLAAAAYSSYVKFSADRVIVH